jgi:hypothetical protein
MYPTASSTQLDYRPTLFLSSPKDHSHRYVPSPSTSWTPADRSITGHQQSLLHQQATLQQPSKDARWTQPVSGLRTPPADEMGTTYQVPNMASYENNHMHRSAYASKSGHQDRTRSAMGESLYDAATRYSTSQGYVQQPQPQPQYQQGQPQPQAYQQRPQQLVSNGRSHSLPSTAPPPQQQRQQQPQFSHSSPPAGPATPSSVKSAQSQSDAATAARDAGMVLHNLQIPACISPKGGDLADFTAQVSTVCVTPSHRLPVAPAGG